MAAADAALWPVGAIRRAFTASRPEAPGRILCLRLERIGDLLMTLPALAELRALAPDATIDLVVGSWNAELATTVSSVDRIETLDARWLARGRDGHALPGLLKRARGWARYRYDLAINFEPDVRSNLLLAVTGARRLVGFASGGGGPLLDLALPYDPREHTTDNAVRLVRAALGGPTAATARPHLRIPEPDREEAARLLSRLSPGPRIAIHVSAGRAVKQWPEARFAQVASRLIADRGASIVLTGATEDRAQVDQVRLDLPADRVIDLSGAASLTRLAALLERVSLIVTGDTGPMHLAQAVGTPIVAVFGPSDPRRYAPRGPLDRVVRIDLPCAPCNRIRVPPARCTGHTPDCLVGVDVAMVLQAVDAVLKAQSLLPAAGSRG